MPVELAILIVIALFLGPITILSMILRHRRALRATSSEDIERVEARVAALEQRMEEHMAELTLMLDEALRPGIASDSSRDEE